MYLTLKKEKLLALKCTGENSYQSHLSWIILFHTHIVSHERNSKKHLVRDN